MKLNLPQETINEILDLLKKRDAAEYKTEALSKYYFTYREIEKGVNILDQKLKVLEIESQFTKELKIQGKSMGFKLGAIMRDKDTAPSIEQGKLLYIYFFTNHKYDLSIPEDLINEEHHHEVELRGFVIPD
ncbi:hypothetical protein KQI37_05695 [Bacillus halotolerans]|uniref:hypothetical protein n=1 Tax=Bacillus halotolerans TaxID=260554 RepID=UPI001C0ECE8D|nr:hypothetical protein [Bacillus halotolerans]MBU5245188.1 hypothetical protein [Bacillus halotolerans]